MAYLLGRYFQCHCLDSVPGLGTEISEAVRHDPPKKKTKKEFYVFSHGFMYQARIVPDVGSYSGS